MSQSCPAIYSVHKTEHTLSCALCRVLYIFLMTPPPLPPPPRPLRETLIFLLFMNTAPSLFIEMVSLHGVLPTPHCDDWLAFRSPTQSGCPYWRLCGNNEIYHFHYNSNLIGSLRVWYHKCTFNEIKGSIVLTTLCVNYTGTWRIPSNVNLTILPCAIKL